MDVERWSAFARTPAGGNPAGVVVLDPGEQLDDARMQRIAAEVGYSETAFLTSAGPSVYDVRYFSPAAEVAFCGHATIASGAALVTRRPALDEVLLRTATVGDVPIRVGVRDGLATARLSSPPSSSRPLDEGDLDVLLGLFGWERGLLDEAVPTAIANAGVDHPVLAVRDRGALGAMTYPFEELRALMERRGWTTVQLVHRVEQDRWDARDPFPVGGVVEDPATGAAAAAFGGLLREHGLLPSSGRFTIRQGVEMGRPSLLEVDARGAVGDPVAVSGTAVPIPG